MTDAGKRSSHAPSEAAAIHPGTRMGPVALRVASLDRSLRYYQEVLGFHLITNTGNAATLGAGGVPLLTLHELPGAQPAPVRATGLYHFAILVPTRTDLGHALKRMVDAGVEIGQADHLVSEALYLTDPDGNGIEVYRDRPRSAWKWKGGRVMMAVDPLDLATILEEGRRAGSTQAGFPAGTTIGHVHLKVGDIHQAQAFYGETLGFEVVAQMRAALFVSAGGYHHHLGLNTWHSLGSAPGPREAAGLESFTIILPSSDALTHLLERLQAAAISFDQEGERVLVRDPWSNLIVLAVEA